MSITSEATKTTNRLYADAYLKRKYPDGSFDSEWIDISRYISGGGYGRITYDLDSGDFDVGLFVTNRINLKISNHNGKFNDIDDYRSYWSSLETRNLSKIKIEAGYLDENGERVEAVPFEGILDETSFSSDGDDNVRFTVLSRESIFKRLNVIPESLGSSVLASDAIYILCNRAEVSEYLTVLEANINPSNDVVIDDPSKFNGKKLDAVLNDLLFITNSIAYVDESGDFIVKSRTHTRRHSFNFYKNSTTGEKDNIYKITGINNGRQRLKNSWFWSGTSLSASSDSHHLERYGVTRRTIAEPSITNTTVIQSILDDQRDEWQFPKQELSIETDYLPNVFSFYDTVTLDVNPRYSRQDDLAISGIGVSGVARSVDFLSGLRISKLKGFKVLSIAHDLNNGRTVLKLRNIGKTLTDGYLEMVLSQTYTVAFSGDTTKDIDVGSDGLNAQYCKVEVLDTGTDYKTNLIEVKRPDANTIRLTSGVAITKTFRILVVETQA